MREDREAAEEEAQAAEQPAAGSQGRKALGESWVVAGSPRVLTVYGEDFSPLIRVRRTRWYASRQRLVILN
jgi:hypothetical protein